MMPSPRVRPLVRGRHAVLHRRRHRPRRRPCGRRSSELDRLLAEAARGRGVRHRATPRQRTTQRQIRHRRARSPMIIAVLVMLVLGMLAFVVEQTADGDRGASRPTSRRRRAATPRRRPAHRPRPSVQAAARSEAVTQRAAAAMATTVWANSPNYGFLALRSGPGIARGSRLLEIPRWRAAHASASAAHRPPLPAADTARGAAPPLRRRRRARSSTPSFPR